MLFLHYVYYSFVLDLIEGERERKCVDVWVVVLVPTNGSLEEHESNDPLVCMYLLSGRSDQARNG